MKGFITKLLMVSAVLFSLFMSLSCNDRGDQDEVNQTLDASLSSYGDLEGIDQVVALINSLDKPLSIENFILAISRNAKVLATYSMFSAQPALGLNQPRVFLKIHDRLVLSVVPGTDTLEIGELHDDSNSKKGDLRFPITEDLSLEDPFHVIFQDDGNPQRNCGFVCHSPLRNNEGTLVPFVSRLIKPRLSETISNQTLKSIADSCTDEGKICDMFRSIFAYGPLEEFNY